jgi:hypothetical protein
MKLGTLPLLVAIPASRLAQAKDFYSFAESDQAPKKQLKGYDDTFCATDLDA